MSGCYESITEPCYDAWTETNPSTNDSSRVGDSASQRYVEWHDRGHHSGELPSSSEATDAYSTKKFVWNVSLQRLLERPVLNATDAHRRQILLADIDQSFREAQKPIAATIVSELHLSPGQKSIPPADIGGLAGGAKYVHDGVVFKFAHDRPGGIYHGNNALAAKAAKHELRGLSSLIDTNTAGLHFPLQAVFDILGFRVIATTLLPIGADTLRYGSADAGRTVHRDDSEMAALIEQAAARLRLDRHPVGRHELALGGDVEGHEGNDGRYYVIDTARVFPPTAPPCQAPALCVPACAEQPIHLRSVRHTKEDFQRDVLRLIGEMDPSVSSRENPEGALRVIRCRGGSPVVVTKPSSTQSDGESNVSSGPSASPSVLVNALASVLTGIHDVVGPAVVVAVPPQAAHLVELMRPEWMKLYDRPLSSDAFSGWGRLSAGEFNAAVREATAALEQRQLPAFAQRLQAEKKWAEKTSTRGGKPVRGTDMGPFPPYQTTDAETTARQGATVRQDWTAGIDVTSSDLTSLQTVQEVLDRCETGCGARVSSKTSPAEAVDAKHFPWWIPDSSRYVRGSVPIHPVYQVTATQTARAIPSNAQKLPWFDLEDRMHSAGLNLRYLGRVRECLEDQELSEVALAYMIARVARRHLVGMLHRENISDRTEVCARIREWIDARLPSRSDGDALPHPWRMELKMWVWAKFRGGVSESEWQVDHCLWRDSLSVASRRLARCQLLKYLSCRFWFHLVCTGQTAVDASPGPHERGGAPSSHVDAPERDQSRVWREEVAIDDILVREHSVVGPAMTAPRPLNDVSEAGPPSRAAAWEQLREQQLEARRRLERALWRKEAKLGTEHPELLSILEALADVDMLILELPPCAAKNGDETSRVGDGGRTTAAIGDSGLSPVLKSLSRAFKIASRCYGRLSPAAAQIWSKRSEIASRMGKAEEALCAARQAVAAWEPVADHAAACRDTLPHSVDEHTSFVLLQDTLPRLDCASTDAEADEPRSDVGPPEPRFLDAKAWLAQLLLEAGRVKKAGSIIEEVVNGWDNSCFSPDFPQQKEALVCVARCMLSLDVRLRAYHYASEARPALDGSPLYRKAACRASMLMAETKLRIGGPSVALGPAVVVFEDALNHFGPHGEQFLEAAAFLATVLVERGLPTVAESLLEFVMHPASSALVCCDAPLCQVCPSRVHLTLLASRLFVVESRGNPTARVAALLALTRALEAAANATLLDTTIDPGCLVRLSQANDEEAFVIALRKQQEPDVANLDTRWAAMSELLLIVAMAWSRLEDGQSCLPPSLPVGVHSGQMALARRCAVLASGLMLGRHGAAVREGGMLVTELEWGTEEWSCALERDVECTTAADQPFECSSLLLSASRACFFLGLPWCACRLGSTARECFAAQEAAEFVARSSEWEVRASLCEEALFEFRETGYSIEECVAAIHAATNVSEEEGTIGMDANAASLWLHAETEEQRESIRVAAGGSKQETGVVFQRLWRLTTENDCEQRGVGRTEERSPEGSWPGVSFLARSSLRPDPFANALDEQQHETAMEAEGDELRKESDSAEGTPQRGERERSQMEKPVRSYGGELKRPIREVIQEYQAMHSESLSQVLAAEVAFAADSEQNGRLALLVFLLTGIYPDQPNPLEFTPEVKCWLGGPDPLDYIPVFHVPASRERGYPAHWHYVTQGLSDLHGDNRSFLNGRPPHCEGRSGFGFELTFRLRIDTESAQGAAPTWPVTMLNQLARYLHASGSVFFEGDNIPEVFPEQGNPVLRNAAIARDPVLPPLQTDSGRVEFLQVVAMTDTELDASREWSGLKVTQMLREWPAMREKDSAFPVGPGPYLVSDMHRRTSLFSAVPLAQARLREGIARDGMSVAECTCGVKWYVRGADQRPGVFAGIELQLDARTIDIFGKGLLGRLAHRRHFLLDGRANQAAESVNGGGTVVLLYSVETAPSGEPLPASPSTPFVEASPSCLHVHILPAVVKPLAKSLQDVLADGPIPASSLFEWPDLIPGLSLRLMTEGAC